MHGFLELKKIIPLSHTADKTNIFFMQISHQNLHFIVLRAHRTLADANFISDLINRTSSDTKRHPIYFDPSLPHSKCISTHPSRTFSSIPDNADICIGRKNLVCRTARSATAAAGETGQRKNQLDYLLERHILGVQKVPKLLYNNFMRIKKIILLLLSNN